MRASFLPARHLHDGCRVERRAAATIIIKAAAVGGGVPHPALSANTVIPPRVATRRAQRRVTAITVTVSLPATPPPAPHARPAMNIFRFLGDLSHLASILILLHKIQTTRSCRGISFKSQLLYLIVFLTRYVDLFTRPLVSVYNTVMKLFFIASTAYTLYLMKFKYRCGRSATTPARSER